MPEIPSLDTLGQAQKSGADHYRTADMHRACALAILASAGKPKADDTLPVDPWMELDRFEQHARLAELHTGLAQARIGAVQLLMRQDEENVTQRERAAINSELGAWADTLEPR